MRLLGPRRNGFSGARHSLGWKPEAEGHLAPLCTLSHSLPPRAMRENAMEI